MELKYIWTGEFRVLNGLDLNFSHNGDEGFKFESNELKHFSVKKTALDFNSKISSITAIAGQNGSGKSSICELLLGIEGSLDEENKEFHFKFKGIICVGNYIFYHQDTNLNNIQQIEANGYNAIPYNEAPFYRLDEEIHKNIKEIGIVYYSNALDWRLNSDRTGVYSALSLIENDFIRSTIFDPITLTEKIQPNFIQAHYYEEFNRIVRFYLNFNSDIPFPTPKHFILSLTHSKNNYGLYFREVFKDHEDLEKLECLEEKILFPWENTVKNTAEGNIFEIEKSALVKCYTQLYCFNLIIALAIKINLFPDIKSFTKIITNDVNYELIPDIFDVFTKHYLRFPRYRELISYTDYINNLNKIYSKLLTVAEFSIIRKEAQDDYIGLTNSFYRARGNFNVPNTKENAKIVLELMDLEEHYLDHNNMRSRGITNFSFSTENSTGEYNYFTLFGRLFHGILNNQRTNKSKNIILILDEADLGFHPTWKKKLLKWTIDFLKNLDKVNILNDRHSNISSCKFQIIFTTHSPYLLSDLTSENLIQLDNQSGSVRILDYDSNKLTFGANIHNLLADNFFMNDGLIGDFAKEKIQSVISTLNKYQTNKRLKNIIEEDFQKEKYDCLKIISIIGDNIVRNKLLEMYIEIFDDEQGIKREIKILENRINYLKSKQKE